MAQIHRFVTSPHVDGRGFHHEATIEVLNHKYAVSAVTRSTTQGTKTTVTSIKRNGGVREIAVFTRPREAVRECMLEIIENWLNERALEKEATAAEHTANTQ